MAGNRPRRTAACNFRFPLQALESGKTIGQPPDDRAPAAFA